MRTTNLTAGGVAERAAARPVVLALACFLLGLAVSAVLFSHLSRRQPSAGAPPSPLSDTTKAILQRLDSPLEIRFYSLLDTSSVPEATIAFAGRVEQLLAAYQQEAAGKLNLLHNQSRSNSVQNTALADGLKPFNLDKGDGCYLGLAVVLDGRKEVLPQLSPEWESAFQSDLSRAIARVLDAAPAAPNPVRNDPALVDEVKKTIPDVTAVTLEEGTKLLRQASLSEFHATGREAAAKVKEAQERFLQAQKDRSEAAQQAALQQLKAAQAEQEEKLSAIAQRSELQIEAFKELKAAAR